MIAVLSSFLLFKPKGSAIYEREYMILAKLYFTNLDFPEIRGFPLLFTTIWGVSSVVFGRDEI